MDDALGDDLFPRHFIIGLDAPTNYVGAREFFLNEESAHLTVDLEDTEEWLPSSHRIDHQIEELHHTLIDAIGCFVLSKAIRILRQQGRHHHSMLVNVSRFTRVQGQVAELIGVHLQLLKDAIQNRHALSVQSALHDPCMRELHRVWREHYAHLPEQWPQIQQALHEAAAGMSVVQINASRQSGSLDYRAHAETGLNVIAVGGNSLSRGFTLEGLTVSYFLRNTQMYDTLLQMGRWFGYRDGFDDLCRLFIKPEAHDWYAFIAEATEELRDEIRRMEAANLTPQDFGLAVRSHPGSLLVTARNKMRTANQIVREVGLADRLVESVVIHAGGDAQEINVDQVKRLVSLLTASVAVEPVNSRGRVPSQLFRAVQPRRVMDFISAFLIHRDNPDMQTEPLLDYIRRRDFPEWDVVMVSNSEASPADTIDISGLHVGLQQRHVQLVPGVDGLKVSGRNRRLASRGIEQAGLTDDQKHAAREAHRLAQQTQDAGATISDRFYRHERSRPLLMLHLIKASSDNPEVNDQVHAAYGISFPKLFPGEQEQRVAYTANLLAYKQLYGGLDIDDDEDQADEG
nr:Z1 domain-containing protein [Luteimonas sp. Y-2-2-4F]